MQRGDGGQPHLARLRGSAEAPQHGQEAPERPAQPRQQRGTPSLPLILHVRFIIRTVPSPIPIVLPLI